jgi:unsaturated rhamnogalacturonyl hydrolase
MKTAVPKELALRAAHKHLQVHGSYDHYTGVVTLHGLARLAAASGDAGLIQETREAFGPYVRGERTFWANFPNYFCGGNGAAYFFWAGHLPEVEPSLRRYSRQILEEAPRDPDGILSHPKAPEANRIWIDTAFAVCPFLLFSGLALGEDAWVEESFQQVQKMVRVFRDPENGLLHQCRNFTGELPGNLSEDHWSRGNGWGLYALTELACHLPETHPRKAESVALFRDQIQSCLNVQDPNGLWHQEMTEPSSYVETSGSALILYALGAGLQAGLLDPSLRASLEKGLSGLLAYISDEIDIYHTCTGCLSPGRGAKRDYMAKAPVLNDKHAFGPIVLCMGQAHLLDITQIHRN